MKIHSYSNQNLIPPDKSNNPKIIEPPISISSKKDFIVDIDSLAKKIAEKLLEK